MFIIKLTGSPFYKSAHYLVVDCAHIVQRSRKRATRMTRAQAEKIAANWTDANRFNASVEAA